MFVDAGDRRNAYRSVCDAPRQIVSGLSVQTNQLVESASRRRFESARWRPQRISGFLNFSIRRVLKWTLDDTGCRPPDASTSNVGPLVHNL